jgi:uncharacterized membrane protein YqjE
MEGVPAPNPGFLGSLRILGDGMLEGLEDRVALIALEIEEEKLRLVWMLCWAGALVFTGFMAVTFASLGLVYLFWESARLAVLGGLASFYLLAFGILGILFRRFLARQARPFSATLQELDADRQCVRNGN